MMTDPNRPATPRDDDDNQPTPAKVKPEHRIESSTERGRKRPYTEILRNGTVVQHN